MRAFWIVVLGLAGLASFDSAASASKVEYSEKELDDYCYSHAGIYKTDRENYWSCEIGSGKSTVHIDCNKTGKCTMWNDVVFTKPQTIHSNVLGKSPAAASQNFGGGSVIAPATASGTNSAVVSFGSATTASSATYSGGKGATNTLGAGRAGNGASAVPTAIGGGGVSPGGRPALRQQ